MTNPITEIDLTELLLKKYSSFYMSEHYSDITLCVEDQELPAHRIIMGASSAYFHTLFSTTLNETNEKQLIIEAPLKPFQIILQYFYTGKITLHDINDIEILVQVIDLVEKYCLFDLKSHFETYFNQILSVDNICQLFEVARTYDLKELKTKSIALIDTNAETVLNSESFNKFSKESLDEILTRNSFETFSQLSLFNALYKWSNYEDRNIKTVFPLLKWHLMSTQDLAEIKNLGNLNAQKIFDAIDKTLEDASIQKFDENFASPIYNVRTLHGDVKLLNGNSTLYDENSGYTRHLITGDNDVGIVIDLRSIRTINHLKMLLWDHDDRFYSYFIEISTDQTNWKRIIDYSSYSCSSWQNLYFQAEPIKFIKIVGTHCSKNEYFDVVTFKAYLRKTIPEIVDGFVAPKDNVALLTKGATILEGSLNGAINGDIDNGCTFHRYNECILIRLKEPYHISSIRLLLSDCGDNLVYKFKIQISLNKKDWETIVNQEQFVTTWQKFSFPPKPVIFIKFIGTEVTNGHNFILKHFECPAQD